MATVCLKHADTMIRINYSISTNISLENGKSLENLSEQPLGILISVSLLHPSNTPEPNASIVEGSETTTRFTQFLNA